MSRKLSLDWQPGAGTSKGSRELWDRTGWRRKAAFCESDCSSCGRVCCCGGIIQRARHSPKRALPKHKPIRQRECTDLYHHQQQRQARPSRRASYHREKQPPAVDENMAKTLIGALALASQALAFSNTSPFFLFSTAEYASPQPVLLSPSPS